jgi:hypothetical protein
MVQVQLLRSNANVEGERGQGSVPPAESSPPMRAWRQSRHPQMDSRCRHTAVLPRSFANPPQEISRKMALLRGWRRLWRYPAIDQSMAFSREGIMPLIKDTSACPQTTPAQGYEGPALYAQFHLQCKERHQCQPGNGSEEIFEYGLEVVCLISQV